LSTELVSVGVLTLNGWDLLLIVVVSIQSTALAYMGHPRWKALLLTLPVPFTLATLSVEQPVGPTNVIGLVLLMGYTYGVYLLHARWRVPIVLSIALCAAGYCGAATALAARLPTSETAFWVSVVGVFALGVLLYRLMPWRAEPEHRSPLPPYIKAPMIAAVILFLVIIKQQLQGFMTVFPMVSLVASYEGRRCLWTLARQIPGHHPSARPRRRHGLVACRRLGRVPCCPDPLHAAPVGQRWHRPAGCGQKWRSGRRLRAGPRPARGEPPDHSDRIRRLGHGGMRSGSTDCGRAALQCPGAESEGVPIARHPCTDADWSELRDG